jgi:MurNAc alpha-1-phosphate uridylyltransferase
VASRSAGRRGRDPGRDQHRLARDAVPGRARRRLALGPAIRYSTEGRDHGGALETAGGIAKALPWLTEGAEHFWVVSGDVFVPGFRFDAAAADRFATGPTLAHLWLVPNAPHHPDGDFGLDAARGLATTTPPRRTWASVGLFRASMFDGLPVGQAMKLRPLLDAALAQGRLGAEAWHGEWTDVGTPARLAQLEGRAAP